ncbi:methyltransferase family protein [Candidatus Methylacidithermus pantelleriae]|nr:isoprenylcysteine carboxylmethyltransferase family protein [Candidatus Methylacidithermus pantelleriae]
MARIPAIVWAFCLVSFALVMDRWIPIAHGVVCQACGAILFLLGLGTSSWAWLLLARHHCLGLPTDAPPRLVQEGPFRWSRNPMYLGTLAIMMAFPFWTGSAYFWLACVLYFAIVGECHIPLEEATLRERFGMAFDSYCQRVRRWL